MQKTASTIVSRIANAIVRVASILILMVVASCNNQILEEGAKKPDPQKDPVVAYYRLTTDSTHIEYVDSNGIVVKTGTLSGYGKLYAQPPLYVDQIYPWQKAAKETLQREVISNEQNHEFNFNYGVNTIKSLISMVYSDGRLISRWPGDKIELRAKSLRVDENPQNGLYYAETTVVYGLYYERAEEGRTKEIELDDVVQPLIAQEDFKDEFLGIKVLRQTHKFNSGVYDVSTGILTCVDTLFYAERWKSGLKNEAFVLVHMQNHISVSTSANIVVDLSKTVGKSWTSNQANLGGFTITETWQSKNIREDKLEAVVNGQTFNLKDSVLHVCRWNPDGGKVESAKKVRLDFAREGVPTDKCQAYLDVNIQQKEVKEVKFLEAKHWKFPTEASINTTDKTFSVDHKDRAWFELIYNDNSSEKDSILYDVNHLFGYSVVNYIPAELKGKTVSIDAEGKVTYNGKTVLTVTFKSRTVKNLTYRGKDYTDKAAKCDLTPKKAFFGESTITVTLSHDNENVTGKIPATYNSVKTYRVVGNPIHLSWNPMGELELTCKNEVIVVEVMMDDSEGQTFKLPYTAYNNWSLVGIIGGEVEQEELDAAIGVPVAVDANGKVTILGSSMTIKHTMHADKVTKGNWSYQPGNCPAVAKYLTPLSATKGRVDVYHDGSKIDQFMVDLGFTVKVVPDTPFEGEILSGSTTDHYADHVSNRTGTDDHVLTKVAEGDYRHYWRSFGSKNWSSETLSSIGNLTGKNLAWWYETNKSTRHLGAVEAYEREGESNRWLLIYKDMNGTIQYHLGKAEETINEPFRYPVQRTLQKVVKDGKTFWTFDNVEFFESK